MLNDEIKNDLTTAIKAGDELTVLVLRSLIAALNNKAIESGKKDEGLNDEEVQGVVLGELKKRKEAQDQYEKAGRNDLAETEEKEAKVLQKYAPEQMSEGDLTDIINDIIKEMGAEGAQDMGKVIGAVMQKVGTKADGSMVSKIVRDKLS